MIDGRHMMGYTLYGIAAVGYVLERWHDYRVLKLAEQKRPGFRRSWRGWTHWRLPKELRQDPEFKGLMRRQILLSLFIAVCILGGSLLTGGQGRGWF